MTIAPVPSPSTDHSTAPLPSAADPRAVEVALLGDWTGHDRLGRELHDMVGDIAIVEPARARVALVAANANSDLATVVAAARSTTAAPIVLVVPAVDTVLLDAALMLGVHDVVAADRPAHEVSWSARRADRLGRESGLAPATSPGAAGPVVVAVFSSKGGVGRTTVACGLAAGFARRGGGTPLLVDLDLEGADVAGHFGDAPPRTIADLAMSNGDLDADKLGGFVWHTDSGVHVLAAPRSRGDAQLVRPDRVEEILTVAGHRYPLVVLDLPSRLDEASAAALERTTTLLVVSTPDVSSARRVGADLDLLDAIGFPSDRIRIVANRAGARAGVTTRDLEHAFGRSIDFHVPSTRDVPSFANAGTPVTTARPASRASRAFDRLASRVAPPPTGRGSRRLLRRRASTPNPQA